MLPIIEISFKIFEFKVTDQHLVTMFSKIKGFSS
jgi:hypothetical protein